MEVSISHSGNGRAYQSTIHPSPQMMMTRWNEQVKPRNRDYIRFTSLLLSLSLSLHPTTTTHVHVYIALSGHFDVAARLAYYTAIICTCRVKLSLCIC